MDPNIDPLLDHLNMVRAQRDTWISTAIQFGDRLAEVGDIGDDERAELITFLDTYRHLATDN